MERERGTRDGVRGTGGEEEEEEILFLSEDEKGTTWNLTLRLRTEFAVSSLFFSASSFSNNDDETFSFRSLHITRKTPAAVTHTSSSKFFTPGFFPQVEEESKFYGSLLRLYFSRNQ